MELMNDKDFWLSLDRVGEFTDGINMMCAQLQYKGFSSEEIEACVEPMKTFREGMIDDLIIYGKKRKEQHADSD